MKIRQNFVSNSSTSSFVAFVPNDIHEEILSQLDEDYAEIIIDKTNIIICENIKWAKLYEATDRGGYGHTLGVDVDNTDISDGKFELLVDAYSRYLTILKDYEGKYLENEEYM